MDQFKSREMRRQEKKAKAIFRRAVRNGEEVSGRDRIKIDRIRGSVRKSFINDLGDEE